VNGGRLSSSALTLAIGYGAAGGLFWVLLNVPESTVPALLASLLLALLIVAVAGLTTAAAVAISQGGSSRSIVRRAAKALPAFLIGIAIFAALWWLTTAADGVWAGYRGEIDALFLRYLGATRTEPLHVAERWLTWMVRWGLGFSVVAALVSAACVGGMRAIVQGLRAAVSLTPLAAVTIGALAVGEGLWRVAAWRPRSLPPSSAELVFVVAKLGLLYLLFAVIAATVLDIHRRAAQRVIAH
jgi:hypothetical protein